MRHSAMATVLEGCHVTDTLVALHSLPAECIDLVYLDPPFATGQTRRLTAISLGTGDLTRSGFGGKVYRYEPRSTFHYRDDMPLDDYLGFLHERLVEVHRVLQPTGSLYLHLDWHVAHSARFMLDSIFGTSSRERTGYPTQTPLKLLERIVRASSNPGELVADFFGGSGTTAVAAAKLGRRYLYVDDNPEAAAIAEKRLADV